MIQLSKSLISKINKILNLANDNVLFSESQLELVTELSIAKADLEYVEYFKNVETLEIGMFPSFSSEEIVELGRKLPKVKSLKIKEQNAIFRLNLSSFNNLEELCLIHNDNLVDISGVNKLNRFTFYDNKDYDNIQQLVDYFEKCQISSIQLDITYYFDIMRYLDSVNKNLDVLKKIKWIESVGLRRFVVHEYTDSEIESLVDNVSYIVSRYVHVTDGDIEKFGVLYDWMINNIEFVNEDDPKGENVSLVSNAAKVLNYRKGGRLSFAKAFQLLLRYAGVNSAIVYSMGAFDTIGFFNGQKVYSLLGESDYAILRVVLDGRIYYCDIAWDCMVNKFKFFDKLRLFLFSKDELRIRHKFVGEGNIENTCSYHGDDSDDLLQFAQDRIKEVDDVFLDIERLSAYINGAEFNIKFLETEIADAKQKLETVNMDSVEYKILFSDFIKLEQEMDEEEIKLIKFEKQRDGIVDSYSNFLVSKYLDEKNRNLDSLTALKEKRFMSKYMYELLVKCL